MRKLGWLFAFMLFTAGPVLADGATTFNLFQFGVNKSIGDADTFTAGGLQLLILGYSAPGDLSQMWAKDIGPIGGSSEMGLGLTNGVDREISGSGFIQLNLDKVFAEDFHRVQGFNLNIGSLQPGEAYDVWGSNTAGKLGVLLAGNQTASSIFIPDSNSKFEFLSITAGGADQDDSSVLLSGVSVVATPEPSTLLLLGAGLVGLLLIARRAAN